MLDDLRRHYLGGAPLRSPDPRGLCDQLAAALGPFVESEVHVDPPGDVSAHWRVGAALSPGWPADRYDAPETPPPGPGLYVELLVSPLLPVAEASLLRIQDDDEGWSLQRGPLDRPELRRVVEAVLAANGWSEADGEAPVEGLGNPTPELDLAPEDGVWRLRHYLFPGCLA